MSITVTFTQDEVRDLKRCLECFEDKLKGVSLLPRKDHGYQQAPYEEITKEKYEQMIAKIKPLNLESVTVKAIGEEGCETDACKLKKELAEIEANKKAMEDDSKNQKENASDLKEDVENQKVVKIDLGGSILDGLDDE